MNLFNLYNKTILITGGSSGIGKATAVLCARLGAKCILCGRDRVRLESVLACLEGTGHSYIIADLSEPDGIEEIVDKSTIIDALIHSAGILKLRPYKTINAFLFEKIMYINLYAPFYLSQMLLKKKKISNNASIIFISSISGNIIGSKGNLMYSASKSAVNGMMKVLALELSEKKIRVNSILAGMVKTEMWLSDDCSVSTEQLEKDELNYPLGYGQPEDIANIIAFLASDATKWITGSSIVADGGFTCQ